MFFEKMRPDEIEIVLHDSPVAYVPLGTLEFHGWHLPLGFDALKAHALCCRVCERTGGAVLPPSYHGFAGGHAGFVGSIITGESCFRANLEVTLGRLAEMGFRVIVALTGHYPEEQMAAVAEMAAKCGARYPSAVFIGLAEPEVCPGEFCGDHAAKWETSIAMELIPEMVDMKKLDEHDDPLYGVCGEDPRCAASQSLGEETVEEIVRRLAGRVRDSLRRLGIAESGESP